MASDVSVILIREKAEQLTGSGCCGKVDAHALPPAAAEFSHNRADQRRCGYLHQTIRKLFPDSDGADHVTIVTVDPRNQLYLTAKIVRDIWRYRPPIRDAMRCLLQWFSLPAVLVNARVVSQGKQFMAPDDLLHAIQQGLRGDRPCPSHDDGHAAPLARD